MKRRAWHEQHMSAMLQAAHLSEAWAHTRRWAWVQGSLVFGSVTVARVTEISLMTSLLSLNALTKRPVYGTATANCCEMGRGEALRCNL